MAGRLEPRFDQYGLPGPLGAPELSGGTPRYLLWVAARLTPRPPELLVVNEAETSLHPDLLPALAGLIATASRHTQLITVCHAPPLMRAIEALAGELDSEVATLALARSSARARTGRGRHNARRGSGPSGEGVAAGT